MKAVKKILFAHGDDNSLGPIFKAILQRETSVDPVLATTGLRVDSVGFDSNEGESIPQSVRSVLTAMGIQTFEHTSKNILLHQDLVSWADLILVPSLKEEDLLCLNYAEAWSKTLPVECYCGQYRVETGFHAGYAPENEDECRVTADIFSKILPYVIDKVKDSYTSALTATGVSICKGTAIGKAYVVKKFRDLESFEEGCILVIDRPGTILFRGLDKTMAGNIIKKFVESPVLTDDPRDIVNELLAPIKGKPEKHANFWMKDGLGAFRAVLTRARALICSRGRHSGENFANSMKIPCISSCVGATERIFTGQTIVIDAGRGEVYDASLLQNLE